jgi:16S rRNA G966 N2-methylase RsmD
MTTPRKLPLWAERTTPSSAVHKPKIDDSNLPAFFHVKASDGSLGYTSGGPGAAATVIGTDSTGATSTVTVGQDGDNEMVTYEKESSQFIRLWGPLLANQGIQMDRISMFSVTPYKVADEITHILFDLVKDSPTKQSKIITDGTACVGGNTISFAKMFTYVNAIEMNENRCSMLFRNVEIARKVLDFKSCSSIKIFCDDFLDILSRLKQDIVFLDPPWGGKDYKSKTTVPLYLCAKPIHEIVLYCLKYSQYVALKLPKNAETSYLQSDPRMEIILIKEFPSFLLLICQSLLTRSTSIGSTASEDATPPMTPVDVKMEHLLVNLVNTKPFQEILKTSANVIKPA